MHALLLSLLFASLALAQEDGGTGVLTKAPVLLQQVEPLFPPELSDAGIGRTRRTTRQTESPAR